MNNSLVALLTDMSVAWADKTIDTRSVKILSYLSFKLINCSNKFKCSFPLYIWFSLISSNTVVIELTDNSSNDLLNTSLKVFDDPIISPIISLFFINLESTYP